MILPLLAKRLGLGLPGSLLSKRDKINSAFRPRARLFQQLGDELIRNECVALLELIKNSYDAGSRSVTIEFRNCDDPEKAEITISDTGKGMTPSEVNRNWLVIGTDNKMDQVDLPEEKLPAGRRPLGEKGIGRFAMAKLGYHVTLVTRAENSREVTMVLDWKKMLEKEFLDEVRIPIAKPSVPKVFKGTKTGTKLTITRLRKKWTGDDRREVKLATLGMTSPFDPPGGFAIEVKSDRADDFVGVKNPIELLDSALFSFDITMKGDRIERFRYEFTPWERMDRLVERTVTEEDPDVVDATTLTREKKSGRQKIFSPINLKEHGIGKIRFIGRIFNRAKKVLEFSSIPADQLDAFLDGNGGVRVYRDGVRVYDYGEPGNDWLKLAARRVDRPGVKLDAGLMVAAVQLERASSKGLVEKTNREGFIEDGAFEALRDSVLWALQQVELLRKADQIAIKELYLKSADQAEPLLEALQELREIASDESVAPNLKKEIFRCTETVEKEYSSMTSTLLKGASSGLHLSMVVHEVEKIVKELRRLLKSKADPERLSALARRLDELLEKYSVLARSHDRKTITFDMLIDEVEFMCASRLRDHGATLKRVYGVGSDELKIFCDKSMMTSALLNLIDNSLFWLKYWVTPDKKLLLKIEQTAGGGTRLTYCDNGRGYGIDRRLLGRPFMSKKPSGAGHGLGLHLVKRISEFHGGSVDFLSGGAANLKGDYEKGAATIINLPPENK